VLPVAAPRIDRSHLKELGSPLKSYYGTVTRGIFTVRLMVERVCLPRSCGGISLCCEYRLLEIPCCTPLTPAQDTNMKIHEVAVHRLSPSASGHKRQALFCEAELLWTLTPSSVVSPGMLRCVCACCLRGRGGGGGGGGGWGVCG
jgi:hypothetical protein